MSNTRKLTSYLWKYFTYIDSHFAKCDICKCKISHKTTMSNLKKHLERKHPLIDLEQETDDYETNQPSTSRQVITIHIKYKLIFPMSELH